MRHGKALFIALIFTLLPGCFSWRTRADDLLAGHWGNGNYQTRVPLILAWETDNGLGRRRALVVPPDVGLPYGMWRHPAPPVANPWGACRSDDVCRNMGDIIAVVPAGTHLHVDRMQRVREWNWWFGANSDLSPFATMLLEGKTVSVDLSDISRNFVRTESGKRVDIPVPDPAILVESP